MKRVFIAIDLPENVKDEIRRIQKKLPKFYGKLTSVDNLHLTLKFLGEIDDEKIEKVKERLGKIKFQELDLGLGELGVFSPKFIRIIWIKLSGAEELQKKVDEVLSDLFKKETRFMGHLTIGRVKKVNVKRFLEDLKKIDVSKIKFKANCFELKESILNDSGPKYIALEKYT